MAAFRHHGRVCQRCGKRKGLQVHHKTYVRLFKERMEDLEVLCWGCHRKEHRKKTRPKKKIRQKR